MKPDLSLTACFPRFVRSNASKRPGGRHLGDTFGDDSEVVRAGLTEGVERRTDRRADVAPIDQRLPGVVRHADRNMAAALLKWKSSPSDADIDQIMNACRCGTYCRIRKAIKGAASSM